MTKPENQSSLILTVIGQDKPGTIHLFAKTAKQCKCSITNCKFSAFGDGFGLLMELSGEWHAIAKAESSLTKLSNKFELDINIRRSSPIDLQTDKVPYYIQITSPDKVGLLWTITEFFQKKRLNIDECLVEKFTAQKTGTKMTNITLHTTLSVKTHLANFREGLLMYCEEYNLDVVMEPLK